MKDADVKSKGGDRQEGKRISGRRAATKTKERNNNQLPMMHSEA
jgi:hypothetical protein